MVDFIIFKGVEYYFDGVDQIVQMWGVVQVVDGGLNVVVDVFEEGDVFVVYYVVLCFGVFLFLLMGVFYDFFQQVGV